MMVMTAKVNMKKILIIVGAVSALIIALLLLLGGNSRSAATAAPSATGNDARVQFLKNFGWEVSASPTESAQVKIPETQSPVYERYNALQKSQGYDLSKLAGKTVMRYVYKINNYPGATDPVYATLLVYKDQIIGGDITDTSARGAIQGFQMLRQTLPEPTVEPSATEPTSVS